VSTLLPRAIRMSLRGMEEMGDVALNNGPK